MKKIFTLFSLLCTLAVAQQLPAQEGAEGGYAAGGDASAACPEARPVGPCTCLYVRYVPQYYNTYSCVQEPRQTTEKAYRMVPKYYDKQCVRYVPQYYNQQCCKYVQECYDVPKTTYVTRQICTKNVKYVPQYFYKQVSCGAQSVEPPAGGVVSSGFAQDSGAGYQGAGCAAGGCCGG